MFDDELLSLASQLGALLTAQGRILTLAESCTGGLAAGLITEIAGSSSWFDSGIVCYSNQAKSNILGVKQTTLDKYGAVSEETAIEMALGALQIQNSSISASTSISASITGIAGPGGGSVLKPVGTVCFAWAATGLATTSCTAHFSGNRSQIRLQAVKFLFEGLSKRLL